jgi:hypothetical protein
MLPVGISQRRKTGCKGTVLQGVLFEFACQNGAGSAVALIAARLGTRQVLMVADKIQQWHTRWEAGRNIIIIENKLQQGLQGGFSEDNENWWKKEDLIYMENVILEPMEITEIISLLGKQASEYGITLYPGADNATIYEFEYHTKMRLPEDLKTFYQFANGFESDKDMFRIIPLHEILENINVEKEAKCYIAEYLIYCDTWDLTVDPHDKNSYEITGEELRTNSFSAFLTCFLKGGVYTGLYDWSNFEQNHNV